MLFPADAALKSQSGPGCCFHVLQIFALWVAVEFVELSKNMFHQHEASHCSLKLQLCGNEKQRAE